MTTHDVHTGTARTGIGYRMVFPPGWREFGTSAEFEEILVKLVTSEAKKQGRADIVLMLRQNIHAMFEDFRRRGTLGFALPVNRFQSGAWPASLIVTPLKTGASGTLLDTVRRVAGDNDVDAGSVDGSEWYLWHSSSNSKDARELKNRAINMVVPRPLPDGATDSNPKAGLWLMYSYLELEQTTPEEMAEGLQQLGYAILGSFKWVPVQ